MATIAKLGESFYDVQEQRMLRMWCFQIRVESTLPSWLNGDLRDMCAYELMRQYFGAPFSRYA